MKSSRKWFIAGAVGMVLTASSYLTYQSDWGQAHLKNGAISEAVVSGYQKTEDFATSTFEKTENFFGRTLFSKDGETVNQTKTRLVDKK